MGVVSREYQLFSLRMLRGNTEIFSENCILNDCRTRFIPRVKLTDVPRYVLVLWPRTTALPEHNYKLDSVSNEVNRVSLAVATQDNNKPDLTGKKWNEETTRAGGIVARVNIRIITNYTSVDKNPTSLLFLNQIVCSSHAINVPYYKRRTSDIECRKTADRADRTSWFIRSSARPRRT